MDFDCEERKPLPEPVSRHPQIRRLLLAKFLFGKEEFGAVAEEEAIIVANEYDPPRAGSFDEEGKALQVGFREFRHVGFERKEMPAARHGEQSIRA